MIRTILNALNVGGAVIGGVFTLITAMLVSFEVVMRYVFQAPTTWTFELTIFLIMYAAYLGSAYTMREGHQVRVEFFVHWLAKYRLPSRILAILCNLVVFVLWAFATWATYKAMVSAWQFNEVTMSYERWPMVIPLAPIAIGGILIMMQLIKDMAGLLNEPKRRN
jgi:TRAP-type C4-dicarboxylate transport system permease small subunit